MKKITEHTRLWRKMYDVLFTELGLGRFDVFDQPMEERCAMIELPVSGSVKP